MHLVHFLCKNIKLSVIYREFIRSIASAQIPDEALQRKRWRRQFLDSAHVLVKGGTGGQGLPKYGGIGGDGGHVYLEADKSLSLRNFFQQYPKLRFIGGVGGNSCKTKLLGDAGADLEVKVPVGITIKTNSGHEIGDLNEDGEKVLVARGGMGGNPNNHFLGLRGEPCKLTLDLKLIADVGFVGFPNAGKSTLLIGMSRAKSKVASYAFTTLRPHVGIMWYDDFRQISLADLPGLIEGAHINVGLGHSFLKHVERTKLLLFIVDVNGFQLGPKWPWRTAFETVMLLNKELELYKAHLIDKPAILAINKVDSENQKILSDDVMRQIKSLPESLSEIGKQFHPENLITFDSVIPISAQHGHNLSELKTVIRKNLDYHADLKLALTRQISANDVPEIYHPHLV